MLSYTDHNVWHVQARGEVWVEAPTIEEAKIRGRDLLVAGEGSLDIDAELYEVKIESQE